MAAPSGATPPPGRADPDSIEAAATGHGRAPRRRAVEWADSAAGRLRSQLQLVANCSKLPVAICCRGSVPGAPNQPQPNKQTPASHPNTCLQMGRLNATPLVLSVARTQLQSGLRSVYELAQVYGCDDLLINGGYGSEGGTPTSPRLSSSTLGSPTHGGGAQLAWQGTGSPPEPWAAAWPVDQM